MRRLAVIGLVVVSWLLAACSGAGESVGQPKGETPQAPLDQTKEAPAETLPASIEIFADFPRYLWHKRRLAIATTNNGTEPITITQLVLRADHFEPLEPEAKTTIITPGSRTDMQVGFGELVDCEASGPFTAHVEMLLAVGDEKASRYVGELDPFPLDEIRRRECAARRVSDAVAIGFADEWTTTDETLSVVVTMDRRSGTAPISITRIQGSEIFAIQLEDGASLPVLAPGDPTGRVSVRIFVTRCDPHVVGQSTRTFDLKAWVAVGEQDEAQLVLVPLQPALKDDLAEMIQTCISRLQEAPT